jgi:hypothetical protein
MMYSKAASVRVCSFFRVGAEAGGFLPGEFIESKRMDIL